MTNNVPETTEMDNVPETTKYYGQGKYDNVTFRFDPQLFRVIKIMAVKENTTIVSLVSEAVATWIKWLRKAEHQEAVLEEAEKTAEELKEATRILDAILLERKVRRRARGRHKRTYRTLDENLTAQGWFRRHPERSWPGVGKRGRGRPRKEETAKQ